MPIEKGSENTHNYYSRPIRTQSLGRYEEIHPSSRPYRRKTEPPPPDRPKGIIEKGLGFASKVTDAASIFAPNRIKFALKATHVGLSYLHGKAESINQEEWDSRQNEDKIYSSRTDFKSSPYTKTRRPQNYSSNRHQDVNDIYTETRNQPQQQPQQSRYEEMPPYDEVQYYPYGFITTDGKHHSAGYYKSGITAEGEPCLTLVNE